MQGRLWLKTLVPGDTIRSTVLELVLLLNREPEETEAAEAAPVFGGGGFSAAGPAETGGGELQLTKGSIKQSKGGSLKRSLQMESHGK